MKIYSFLAGILCGGLIVAVVPLAHEPSAAWISQAIYDCGIRIAADVSEGTINGFIISNHKMGVCLDEKTFNIKVSDTTVTAP